MTSSCHPMDCSPPGSRVHGLSQARILEGIAISFSRVSSQGSNPHLLCLLHWEIGSLPLSHIMHDRHSIRVWKLNLIVMAKVNWKWSFQETETVTLVSPKPDCWPSWAFRIFFLHMITWEYLGSGGLGLRKLGNLRDKVCKDKAALPYVESRFIYKRCCSPLHEERKESWILLKKK